MNLYKISQDVDRGWETFDSAVVVAKSAEEAKEIVPDFNTYGNYIEKFPMDIKYRSESWVKPEDVKVELIGVIDDDYLDMLNQLDGRTTVVSSFNAG